MNALTLSGSIRSGSIRPRPAARGSSRVVSDAASSAPSAPLASPLRAEERGGVWHVVNAAGASLAPCASQRTAEEFAATLARLPTLAAA